MTWHVCHGLSPRTRHAWLGRVGGRTCHDRGVTGVGGGGGLSSRSVARPCSPSVDAPHSGAAPCMPTGRDSCMYSNLSLSLSLSGRLGRTPSLSHTLQVFISHFYYAQSTPAMSSLDMAHREDCRSSAGQWSRPSGFVDTASAKPSGRCEN